MHAMASFLTKAVISFSVFFFFLGFIFAIVGYFTFWLIPREEYAGGTSQIDGVGLREACFTNFRFTNLVHLDTEFVRCYDNSRASAIFEGLPEDVWSPRWFQTVQEMHLASVIMMVFNMLLIAAFLAIYIYVAILKNRLIKNNNRKPLSPGLRLLKCAAGLWFILAIIIGVLLLFVEPLMFYTNYEQERHMFYYGERPFDYGPGFGMTIGAGLAMFVSAGLSIVTFCGMVRKVVKTTFHPEEQGNRDSYADSTEMDRLSDDVASNRREPDGKDGSVALTEYKSEPDSHRRSQASLPASQYDKDQASQDSRPIPTPRPRLSVSSREPSVSKQEVAEEYSQQQFRSPPRSHPPPSYSDVSKTPSRSSVNPKQFVFDYQPGVGYVPKSARPVSDTESMRSAQSRTPYSPSSASPYYNPSQQRGVYAGSIASDSDSVRTDRNRSIVGSARQTSPQPPPGSADAIRPKSTTDVKKSRYAAAGW